MIHYIFHFKYHKYHSLNVHVNQLHINNIQNIATYNNHVINSKLLVTNPTVQRINFHNFTESKYYCNFFFLENLIRIENVWWKYCFLFPSSVGKL